MRQSITKLTRMDIKYTIAGESLGITSPRENQLNNRDISFCLLKC